MIAYFEVPDQPGSSVELAVVEVLQLRDTVSGTFRFRYLDGFVGPERLDDMAFTVSCVGGRIWVESTSGQGVLSTSPHTL